MQVVNARARVPLRVHDLRNRPGKTTGAQARKTNLKKFSPSHLPTSSPDELNEHREKEPCWDSHELKPAQQFGWPWPLFLGNLICCWNQEKTP